MADDKPRVSMLDLQADTEEIRGFNPEADANAMLPPVPAGRYSVLVKFEEDDPDKRFVQDIWAKGTANQQKVYYTQLACTIYGSDDSVNGRTLRTMVSTFTMRGTNSVQGALQALGQGEALRGIPRTPGALILLLTETLSQETHAEIMVDWEATEKLSDEERDALKDAGKKPWRIQGMTRFPKDSDGNYIPEIEHKGAPCRAYNIVDRWITAGTGTASAGVPTQQTVPPTPAASRPVPRSAAPPTPAAAPVPRRSAATGAPVPAGRR